MGYVFGITVAALITYLAALFIVIVLPLIIIIHALRKKQPKSSSSTYSTTSKRSNSMKYTKTVAIMDVSSLVILRAACVISCFHFFLPMINTTISYFDLDMFSSSNTLTGFNMIFGVAGSNIYGSPFALMMFVFPIIVLMISFLDFLSDYVYTVLFISGILGVVLSVVFFVSALFKLNGKESIFDVTIYEMRAGLSWGVLPVIGTYILISVLAMVCKKLND
jgi:hypothetical protein